MNSAINASIRDDDDNYHQLPEKEQENEPELTEAEKHFEHCKAKYYTAYDHEKVKIGYPT